ncbi:MAG: T9SS type A sorting domain-containing protein [Candidatus Sabulitectum sp.]|nr:T9SS type A sorting domain-containing protein [Candidatus Sabulitectum sp.]
MHLPTLGIPTGVYFIQVTTGSTVVKSKAIIIQ